MPDYLHRANWTNLTVSQSTRRLRGDLPDQCFLAMTHLLGHARIIRSSALSSRDSLHSACLLLGAIFDSCLCHSRQCLFTMESPVRDHVTCSSMLLLRLTSCLRAKCAIAFVCLYAIRSHSMTMQLARQSVSIAVENRRTPGLCFINRLDAIHCSMALFRLHIFCLSRKSKLHCVGKIIKLVISN